VTSTTRDPHHTGRMPWDDPDWKPNPKRRTEATTPGAAKTQNLLHKSDNDAVKWWDHDVNPESLWRTAKLMSRKEAAWICPKCGTKFTKPIYEMTQRLGLACPTCQAKWKRDYERKRKELSTKTVADIPHLMAIWADPTPPDQVPVLDSGYYKFRCANGHQSTRRPYSQMGAECQYCKNAATRKANAEAATADPTSARLSPEISSQWHPTRNGKTELAKVPPNSRTLRWWRDPVCGHEWEATPRERDKYLRLRCPFCKSILDSLAFHYPEIAAQWAPENPLSPWHVRPTGKLDFDPIWVCPNDPAHRWTASTHSRVNGSTCPDCRETGKSRVEIEHLAAARKLFGSAASGNRMTSPAFGRRGGWTVDILVTLVSGHQIAIEYDGAYWHADKAGIDSDKSADLLAAGLTVVRLREAPLPALGIDHPRYHEVTVYSDAPDAPGVMSIVKGLVDR